MSETLEAMNTRLINAIMERDEAQIRDGLTEGVEAFATLFGLPMVSPPGALPRWEAADGSVVFALSGETFNQPSIVRATFDDNTATVHPRQAIWCVTCIYRRGDGVWVPVIYEGSQSPGYAVAYLSRRLTELGTVAGGDALYRVLVGDPRMAGLVKM